MKISTLVSLGLMLIPIAGFAQGFSHSFIPSSITVNSLSITSFDPDSFVSQPLLSNLTVNYSGDPKPRMDIKVRVVWNNHKLAETDFESKPDMDPALLYPVVFTSRQLISNEGHPIFSKKPYAEDISISNILKSPTFGDAVMAGYFPDGNLQIRVWLREYSEAVWTVPETSEGDDRFSIIIRNAGNISLLAPGVAIGANPPRISGAPLSFLWNSLDTGFNTYELSIREYPASQAPTLDNVANTGYLMYQTPPTTNEQSGFSDYLPFSPGKYYAWRIRTKTITEEDRAQKRIMNSPYLTSNWYVFQYADEADITSEISELQVLLKMLDNDELKNIFNEGYKTIGTVIYNNRTYSGQDALDLVETLMNKEIQVKLQD